MKKISLIKVAWLFLIQCYFLSHLTAQLPDKISYQATMRNSEGELISNTNIGLRISILHTSRDGESVYSEIHKVTSDRNGLIHVEIGAGTVQNGRLTDINWADSPWFIKTEADPSGGENYSIVGISQILTVPYAIHAKTAEQLSGDITENDPLFSEWDRSTGIEISESQIRDLNYFSTENETDPLFNNSPAANIRPEMMVNWSEAHEWGDHSEAGYVHESRTLTINGISNSLENEPSWRVGTVEQIVTGSGITTNTGDPITDIGEISLSGQALDFHNLSTSGFVVRGGSGNILTRSILPGEGISVENSTAIAGNPEISIKFGSTANTAARGDHVHDKATTVKNGFMSSEDKTKINRIKTYEVGDLAHGGIVFWMDESEQHGLVCALEEQGNIRWNVEGDPTPAHAFGDGPYAGEMNTMLIIAAQARLGSTAVPYAASVCNELLHGLNGNSYGDWYLPSKTELQLIFENKLIINETVNKLGGEPLTDDYYWSSTERESGSAYVINMETGFPGILFTDDKYRVRAVRSF